MTDNDKMMGRFERFMAFFNKELNDGGPVGEEDAIEEEASADISDAEAVEEAATDVAAEAIAEDAPAAEAAEVIAEEVVDYPALLAEKDTTIAELTAANAALREQVASYTTVPGDDITSLTERSPDDDASAEEAIDSIFNQFKS